MAQDVKKSEKAVSVRKPARESQELGQYFEDVFGRPFLPEAWGKLGWEEKIWAGCENPPLQTLLHIR